MAEELFIEIIRGFNGLLWKGGTELAKFTLKKGVQYVVTESQKAELQREISKLEKPLQNVPKQLEKEITNREIKASGFFFGRKGNSVVFKPENEDGHVLVVGGVGSGKSSCIAIPTLLSWRNRVFAIDIKGELYAETKHRRLTAKVFNPLDNQAYGYNPYYVLEKMDETQDKAPEMYAIAMDIIPLPPSVQDPFWIEQARNLLTGLMLHYYNVGNTFIETMATISSTPIVTLIKAVAENTTTPAVMFYLNNFVNMNEKTLLGVFAELSRNITLFITDSNVSTALSKDKVITPDDLERGHDIFINIPESRLRQWKGMLTLIVSQFLRHFENRPDKNNSPILFLLDEFARLGKLEGITDGLATLRSKKITICPIIQDLAQLDYIYGTTARQVIVGTCQYQVIFNVTDGDSQKYFSELLGKYKEIKISKTQNFDITNLSTGASTHTNTEDRPRLESWDFYTLPDIVLLTPYGFCRIDKDPYYKYKKV